jgi:predicted membrane GTPase involved in stress response
VEVTPKAIRLRKMELNQQKRESVQKKERLADEEKN